MSEYDDVDDESMIKYLREKIIGRPAVFSRAGDIPIDDSMPPIKRTNSQNSLSDDLSTNQLEKLNAGGNSFNVSRRPISSSSPIIIPKKPPRSNASSQSSSSYTSVVDQTSSLGESSIQTEDVSNSTFPTLPSSSQQLEHSAARDRISVKNKRRQPLKEKLSTLRETDDNENDLFSSKTEAISSTPEEEPSGAIPIRIEPKVQQPLIDLSDLGATKARLRMSTRPRDRSADNILLATNSNSIIETSPSLPPAVPIFSKPIQRSVSFKRPQEINETKTNTRPILKAKKQENNDKPIEKETPLDEILTNNNDDVQINVKNSTPTPTESRSRSSSQEHIYDNLDVFKRPKANNVPSNEDESSTPVIKPREHSSSTPRLRPVTVHVSATNDKQTTNEFENVFNQLRKRGSIRKVQPKEETTPEPLPPPPAPVEEPPPPAPIDPPSQSENEPTVIPSKPTEPVPIPQTPNRRKTVGGVHLPANNKVATDDNKPTPSWIDIAKQKQSKFQNVSNEKPSQDEHESEPPVTVRKQASTADTRSNRKSMFEQPTTQLSNAHALERDSIRALKAGNPNRINNLIQFFDK